MMMMMMNRLFVVTALLLLLTHDPHPGVAQAFTVPSSSSTTTRAITTKTMSPLSPCSNLPKQAHSKRVATMTTTMTTTARTTTTQLYATPDLVGQVAQSLFRSQGPVPLVLAAAVNAVGFATLSAKLATMLTPAGFAHAFCLGTGLWATLGWRGWTYCVLYFFFGQAVTKLRFQEKEVSTNKKLYQIM